MEVYKMEINLDLEEWKVSTDEAMHFNDLLMRNRQIGFSIILAILWGSNQISGDIGYINGIKVSYSLMVAFLAVLFTIALYLIDLNYYFRLLLGAVERSTALEDKLGFGLTKKITEKVSRARSWGTLHAFYLLILICNLIFIVSKILDH
jgi:hypothetical protein